jgi:uncharacterized protein (TIGR02284 family)
MENIEKTIKTLKDLIFILQDSNNSYQNAAEIVDNPSVKDYLLVYSRERAFYLLQLQDEMEKLGQPYNDSGYYLHKTWNNFKNAFTFNSFLSTCIQNEEKLISKYLMSLKEVKFYSSLSLVLQNQLAGVEKTLSHIKYQQIAS